MAAADFYRSHFTKYRRFFNTTLHARSTGKYIVGENRYKRILKYYSMDYTIDEMI